MSPTGRERRRRRSTANPERLSDALEQVDRRAWLALTAMFGYLFDYLSYSTGDTSFSNEGATADSLLAEILPANVPHDVRNLGQERCVIMFLKLNPKVLKAGAGA